VARGGAVRKVERKGASAVDNWGPGVIMGFMMYRPQEGVSRKGVRRQGRETSGNCGMSLGGRDLGC